jgi:hypothetical protein
MIVAFCASFLCRAVCVYMPAELLLKTLLFRWCVCVCVCVCVRVCVCARAHIVQVISLIQMIVDACCIQVCAHVCV